MSPIADRFRQFLAKKRSDSFFFFLIGELAQKHLNFLLAGAVVISVSIAGIALLLHEWRVTPTDFTPEIRVSGYNWLKGAAFKRKAKTAESRGDTTGAVQAWQNALGHSPGDAEALRGYLGVVGSRGTTKDLASGSEAAFWLLQSNGKTVENCQAAANYFFRVKQFPMALAVLRELDASERPASLRSLEARAALMNGEFRLFEKLAAAPDLRNLPELDIYNRAAKARFDPAELEELKEICRRNRETNDAAELCMVLGEYLRDRSLFEVGMANLVSASGDDMPRLRHARFLFRAGAAQEAKEILGNLSSGRPETDMELSTIAQMLEEFGMKAEAVAFLGRSLNEMEVSEETWFSYVNMVFDSDDIAELERVVHRLENEKAKGRSLGRVQAYAQGSLALKQGNGEAAKHFFASLRKGDFFISPRTMVHCATLVYRADRDSAAELLEAAMMADSGCLEEVVNVALEHGDLKVFLQAAKQGWELHPDDVDWAARYLSALLASHQNPEEAIALSLRLAKSNNSVSAKLNHALALNLNHRYGEAREVLKSLPPEPGAGERSHENLAWAQIYQGEGNVVEARKCLSRVEPEFHFPEEIQSIEPR